MDITEGSYPGLQLLRFLQVSLDREKPLAKSEHGKTLKIIIFDFNFFRTFN